MPNYSSFEPTQGPGGGLGGFFMGTPAHTMQFQRFNPQQQQALSSILQSSLGGLQKTGFGDFGPIEDRARTQFHESTIPTIAERFTSMGGQGSSAFKQSLGQAGSGLEQGLAALRSQYGLHQQQNLQSLLGMGLQPQFENTYSPRQPGFLEQGWNTGAQASQGLLKLLPLLFGL